MNRIAVCPVGVAALALAACSGSGDRGPDLSVTIDTVAGVVLVSNFGAAPEWELVERVRLGVRGGLGETDRPDEFGRVTGVVSDASGTIFVGDALAKEIRVFSAGGEFVRRFGRDGAGPGEFRSIQSLGLLGDTVVVMDPRNGRLGFLSAEGEWLGQRAYQRVSGPDIRIFQTGPSEFWIPAVEGTMSPVFVRHRSNGVLESVPLQTPGGSRNFYVFCRHNRGFHYFVPDWAPHLVRAPAPGGNLIEGWGGIYRLAWLGLGGDTGRVVQRDLPPLIPTDAEWDTQVAQFDSMMSPFAGLSCEPRRPVRPDEMGLIRAVFFDEQERMWVERRTHGGFVLDAFDRGGAVRASVPIPDRVQSVPIFIRGDRLYLVVEDELGVHSVVGFEVRGPEGR